jgi:hypothetical protein
LALGLCVDLQFRQSIKINEEKGASNLGDI